MASWTSWGKAGLVTLLWKPPLLGPALCPVLEVVAVVKARCAAAARRGAVAGKQPISPCIPRTTLYFSICIYMGKVYSNNMLQASSPSVPAYHTQQCIGFEIPFSQLSIHIWGYVYIYIYMGVKCIIPITLQLSQDKTPCDALE